LPFQFSILSDESTYGNHQDEGDDAKENSTKTVGNDDGIKMILGFMEWLGFFHVVEIGRLVGHLVFLLEVIFG
jgi:hypothetical protein